MLGYKTKAILALIATLMIGIFVFALAQSISSGFAGFYGGLPFWLIVIFVMGLAIYDYLEECIGIGEQTKFLFRIGAVIYCGMALTYGSWGTSTLFADKGELLIRSVWFDNYTVQAIWFEIFWMVFSVLAAAFTVVLAMRMIGNRERT